MENSTIIYETVLDTLKSVVDDIHKERCGPGPLNDWAKERALFCCGGCNVPIVDHYMVHDDLWVKHAGDNRFLCVACFEQRIGRPLYITDFTPAPINEPYFIGALAVINVRDVIVPGGVQLPKSIEEAQGMLSVAEYYLKQYGIIRKVCDDHEPDPVSA